MPDLEQDLKDKKLRHFLMAPNPISIVQIVWLDKSMDMLHLSISATELSIMRIDEHRLPSFLKVESNSCWEKDSIYQGLLTFSSFVLKEKKAKDEISLVNNYIQLEMTLQKGTSSTAARLTVGECLIWNNPSYIT